MSERIRERKNSLYKIILLACALAAVIGLRGYLRATFPLSIEEGPEVTEPLAEKEETPDLRKVNLNKGSLEDLMTLPGVGEKTARRIMKYKKLHGPFQSVESILEVGGIGPKKFEKMEPYLTVR